MMISWSTIAFWMIMILGTIFAATALVQIVIRKDRLYKLEALPRLLTGGVFLTIKFPNRNALNDALFFLWALSILVYFVLLRKRAKRLQGPKAKNK